MKFVDANAPGNQIIRWRGVIADDGDFEIYANGTLIGFFSQGMGRYVPCFIGEFERDNLQGLDFKQDEEGCFYVAVDLPNELT